MKAKSAFANLNATPQAKAALIARYVADREAGFGKRKAPKGLQKVSPNTAKPSTYVHENLEGLATGTVVERKPGELQPNRVSRSARTEERLREKSQAEWRKAIGKDVKKSGDR